MRPQMPPWADRPADFGNLFNPAFLATVVAAVCEGYAKQKEQDGQTATAMPFALAFLAAPLAISPDFNSDRPTQLRSKLPAWIDKKPHLRASIGAASFWLVPTVREGLVFALRGGSLTLDDQGDLSVPRESSHGSLELDIRVELSSHLSNSAFVGRWLAKGPSPASLFEAFGIRP